MTSSSSVYELKHQNAQEGPRLTAIEGGGGSRETVETGWRAGKPMEDPAKMKRWGFITATPSEYLIHMRRGKIRRRSSGQGASCFKWPWDSVAVVPTTINRLRFTADQVTREKVGVSVTGLAVYRIVEPEQTYRMLNFSFSERASEKLGDVIGEMFVGATRRHVANLTVEEAMTKRKESIALALMKELAPVLGGAGKVEDTTGQGWGVVLDTIEIQDVKVLSETVFRDMQATFRAELAMKARQAELASAKEIETREAQNAREIEEAKIAAQTATREMKAQAESRSTEIEVREQSKREALQARAAEERVVRRQAAQVADLRAKGEVAAEQARQEEASRLETIARDQRFAAAERELIEARHQAAMREAELEALLKANTQNAAIEFKERESKAAAGLKRRELELAKLHDEVRAMAMRARREIENLVSDDRIRMKVAEGLPELAGAFAQTIGEVRMTTIGGDAGDPSAIFAGGIARFMEIARGLGIDLGGSTRTDAGDAE